MKLRYYLRGLGLGILLTSILFLAGPKKQSMSNEEIKEKAKELGMVESTVLTELESSEFSTENFKSETEEQTVEIQSESEQTLEEQTVETSEENTENVIKVESNSNHEDNKGTENESPANGTDKIANPEVTETTNEAANSEKNENQEAKEVIITVHSGDGSGTVAQYLQAAGIVDDAHEFDQFLMANGYDKRISAGQHSFLTTDSWDEIGKSLCNLK